MPRPTHILWPQLPTVVQQLRFGRAMARSRGDVDYVTLATESGNLMKRFTASARHVVGEEASAPRPLVTGTPPLDDYFARLAAQVEDDISRGPGAPPYTEVMSIVVDGARESVGALCESCRSANSAEVACQFLAETKLEDWALLSAGGHCLDPLTEWFQFCKAQAEQAYNAVLEAPVSPSTLLSTAHTNVPYKELSTGFSAKVKAHTDGRREVTVQFVTNQVDHADYLALPYTLFHECFAHCMCGLTASSTASASFHEGWMDEVASRILARLLNESPAPAGLPVESGEFEARMVELRSERTNLKRTDAPADAPLWRKGIRAFEALVELFGVALNSGPHGAIDPDLAADHFSMRLNANPDFSHGSRKELVTALSLRYVRKTPAAQTRLIQADGAMQAAVRSYVATRDAPALAGALIALRVSLD